MNPVTIVWFRRDLRLQDQAALFHALKQETAVLPLFIFDRNILDDLVDRADPRVTFIHQTVAKLKSELEEMGSTMLVRYGRPEEVWESLLDTFKITAVYTNRDFEPYARLRDERVADLLSARKVPFFDFKDQVIFQYDEVLKPDGKPYTVFTPYSRRWKEKLNSKMVAMSDENGVEGQSSYYLQAYPCDRYYHHFISSQHINSTLPSLEDMGFRKSDISFPPAQVARGLIRNYDKTRNFPALASGTSRLGIHFRFGTISIREKARHALALNETYLNELIWRDFYSQILAHFPQVTLQAFKSEYDKIAWRKAPEELEKWQQGKTGYPIVDAGMRELNATGYMHNRVRMIVASFLTKHLLIDWRLGEAYFAQKLLDFDLASNNGGWQWAAGCGTDAAPYFRIFNPLEQTKKFDPDYVYIRRWVPEFGTAQYVKPIVDHAFARNRCLQTYKQALSKI